MLSSVIRFQTSFFVQLASGLIFTRPNFLSQPTIAAWARSALWSRRMPLIQACITCDARCSVLILRSKQHWFGIRLVERPAVQRFVLRHRELRLQQVDLDAVLLGDAVAQVERLLELVARLEVEHVRFRRDLGQHRQDHAAFRPEGRGHRQVGCVVARRPRR